MCFHHHGIEELIRCIKSTTIATTAADATAATTRWSHARSIVKYWRHSAIKRCNFVYAVSSSVLISRSLLVRPLAIISSRSYLILTALSYCILLGLYILFASYIHVKDVIIWVFSLTRHILDFGSLFFVSFLILIVN